MKKLLSLFVLAVSIVAISPGESRAYWNSPQTTAGFGWWHSRALNFFPSAHFHGPLYNYGPYYGGYGYQDQFVRNPHIGSYMPAYPSVYQNMPGHIETQWNTVNPVLTSPVYPQAPIASPSDFFSGAQPAQPVQPMAQAPQMQVVPDATPIQATPTSGRFFRNRSQR